MTYTEPLLAVICVLIFIGWMRVRQHQGSALVGWALIGLIVVSWPPIDWVLSRPLEAWYPVRPFEMSAPAEAIVVLSAGVDDARSDRPYPLPDSQTDQRCEFAAWLYHNWRPLPVLACGGRGSKRQPAFSVTMRRLLERAGVPTAMIWTEERSRSTHENAVFGSEILRLHGVKTAVLVVDASSMPRATACFQKNGIGVIPAPSNFRTLGPVRDELLPSWKAVQQNELTMHELLALGWYRLRGWM